MKTGEKYKCIIGLDLLHPFIDVSQYTYGREYEVHETKGGKCYILTDPPMSSEVFGLRPGHFELIKNE